MARHSFDTMAQRAQQRDSGLRLAKEARDRGDHRLAWKHAQAYNLNHFDVLDLGLPEKHRPKGFKPRIPEARGCIS